MYTAIAERAKHNYICLTGEDLCFDSKTKALLCAIIDEFIETLDLLLAKEDQK
jgi:hypothetical protein